MTAEEGLLWQRLRGQQLDGLHFRRQQVIDGFIADFYCHAASLVVEIDGPMHEQHADYDSQRDEIMRARGLRLLRLTDEEVRADPAAAVSRIRRACRS